MTRRTAAAAAAMIAALACSAPADVVTVTDPTGSSMWHVRDRRPARASRTRPPSAAPAAPTRPAAITRERGRGTLTDTQLRRLRWCESRGDYRAVSRTGRFRGAYQFDRATWRSVGGSGDPAAASPAEQDARARALYSRRGRAPWPHCGRSI